MKWSFYLPLVPDLNFWRIQEFQVGIQKFKNFKSEEAHEPATSREELEKEHSSENFGLHLVAFNDSSGVF